jgi:tRNA-dihydrouridine synthase B
LLSRPELIERIVAAVSRAVAVPVTLKIRSGPDAEHETAVEIAQRVAGVGAAAVDVHARSVAQAYVGGPDWTVVERVKRAVTIPVLGSGGIREPADAIRFLRETGADGVAIGRGCLGNPWIFRQSRNLVQHLPPTRAPTASKGRWCAPRNECIKSLPSEKFQLGEFVQRGVWGG